MVTSRNQGLHNCIATPSGTDSEPGEELSIYYKYNIFADQGILIESPHDGGWLGVADNGGCQSGKWVAGWAGAGLR